MNKYISEIIKLAKKASEQNEVPVGAIIVYKDTIIARAYNQRENKNDVLGHAEIIAIKRASKKLQTWKLSDCDMYVTLKPCSMCEKIIKEARIKNVYYLLDKLDYKKEYNKTNVCVLDCETEYSDILKAFFVNKRNEKK